MIALIWRGIMTLGKQLLYSTKISGDQCERTWKEAHSSPTPSKTQSCYSWSLQRNIYHLLRVRLKASFWLQMGPKGPFKTKAAECLKINKSDGCHKKGFSIKKGMVTKKILHWPGGEKVVHWVPGTDKNFGFMPPQDHSFTLGDLHIPVHFHHLWVVICREDGNKYKNKSFN